MNIKAISLSFVLSVAVSASVSLFNYSRANAAEPRHDSAMRTVSVTVDNQGFSPASISVKRGST